MEMMVGDRLTVELDDGRVVEGRYLAPATPAALPPTYEETILERLFGNMSDVEVRQVERAVERLSESFDHMERTLRETNEYLRERNGTAG